MQDTDERRQWQREATAAYMRKNAQDFLLVATPGSGKTRFALGLTTLLMSARTTERVIVVVPTSSLKHQWAAAAQMHYGIKLDDEFLNSHFVPADDFDGVVVTYQQVAANPLIFRRLVGQGATLAIFDEIHHAGHQSGWGAAMVEAFDFATRRLSVTGTPFRSDNQRIPFVEYGIDGRSAADYSFSYADATRTDPPVCREVFFHMYGGEIRWEDDDGIQTHTLGDEADDRTNSKAMRSALSIESRWLPEIIERADRRLLSVRENEYPEAAGLVLAKDRLHAIQIAAFMEKSLGERPVVVVSDNPDDDKPSRLIKRFAFGDYTIDGNPYEGIPRWVVAVKMVSEGVDIPRLAVGVYATNYVTELFFRQAIGRFVRVTEDAPGVAAYVFVPRHPVLNGYAEQIAEERDHLVTEEDEEDEEGERRERPEQLFDYFNPLPSTVDPLGIIINGKAFTRTELVEAKEYKRQIPSFRNFSDEYVMVVIRDLKMAGLWRLEDAPIVQAQRPVQPLTQRERKHEAKGRVRSLVREVMKATNLEFEDVYAALKREDGTSQTQATLEQLEQRIERLHAWLKQERERYAS
ncbi:MAG: DEAD/DEAH box helicase family protein [Chloroflexota bacterium]|nr:DEAD/DEAH box helicase family protein [Chloroflexota bacterium]